MNHHPDVATTRVYSWAAESRLTGLVDAAKVRAASGQFQSLGGGRCWLIDASGAQGLSVDALEAIRAALAEAARRGTSTFGIALPRMGLAFSGFVPSLAPPGTRAVAFSTHGALRHWASRSCP